MKIIIPICFAALFATTVHADDIVAAKVNGSVITSREVEEQVDRMVPRSTFHGSVSEEKRNEFREKALGELIIRELQYQDARTKGMKPDKKQVKARMKEIRERFQSRKEYRKALEQAGITEEDLQKRVEKAVLAESVVEKTVSDPARMTDEALKEYYAANTSKFRQPESVRLRIISVKDEKKAGEALARVTAGEDFGSVAAKISEDKYRIKGGDIGYIHKGRIFPELEEAAFSAPAGEVKGPIKAEGTWFVINVEDRRPERQMSFEESRDKLKRELEAKKAAELMETWTAGLKEKAAIEVLP